MREILFRGKRIDNGEWIYGLLTREIFYDMHKGVERAYCIKEIPETVGDSYLWVRVDTETVGQYTGLTDKNGKKIFEGDIVEFSTTDYCGGKYYGKVVFRKGCYGIEYVLFGETKLFHRIGEIGRWQDMGASGTITYKYQKIGNIHDNPELLKEVKNVC